MSSNQTNTISGILEKNALGFVLKGKQKVVKLDTNDLRNLIELYVSKCKQTKIKVHGVFEGEEFQTEKVEQIK